MDADKLTKLWRTHTPTQIAAKLKVTRNQVYQAARTLNLPSRTELLKDVESPTAEEIEARAAAVRRTWSQEELESRLVGNRSPKRWTPPEIRVGEIEPPSYSRI